MDFIFYIKRGLIIVINNSLFHLFADFGPGLLQTVDGTAIECRCDLQYSVVVVETAADVSHGNPLLYGVGPRAHISVGHYLWCHQVTHLQKKKEREHKRTCAGYLQSQKQKGASLKTLKELTSLKCWLVFMMYGVLSVLSTFIQPWPRNSLREGGQRHVRSCILKYSKIQITLAKACYHVTSRGC